MFTHLGPGLVHDGVELLARVVAAGAETAHPALALGHRDLEDLKNEIQ